MVLAKSKNAVGLGNTLMNDRFGKGKGADRKKATGIHRINHATGETVGFILEHAIKAGTNMGYSM
jgi:large subunit GTPase 1